MGTRLTTILLSAPFTLEPGEKGRGALHKALFRNWSWEWKTGKE